MSRLDLHLLPQPPIEGAERFVEQQHPRSRGERARQGDALLAARQLARLAGAKARKAHQCQEVGKPPLTVAAVDMADVEAEADIVGDGEMGEQGIILEHHADVAAMNRHRLNLLAIEGDGAAIGNDEAGNGAQRRRLAGAGGPSRPKNSPSAKVMVTSSSATTWP